MDKYIGKFVGPNKVASVELTELVTPRGDKVFSVIYVLGHKDLFPEKTLDLLVTDEIKDLNYIREIRVNLIVPQIIDLIKEYDLPGGQINYLLSMIGNQWNNNFSRAYNYLFYGDDRLFVPGYEPATDFTLLMAERINKKIPPKEDVAG